MRAIYVGYCLLRELNHRLTGVSREASPATTIFVTGVLAGALHSVVAPMFRPFTRLLAGRPSPQSAGAALAVGRYISATVGGEPLRSTPHGDLFIALGFVRPMLDVMRLPAQLARAALAGASRAWRFLTVPVRNG